MFKQNLTSSNTKERIKEAFLESVSEVGFLRTRITSICKKADIHRSTFYSYYEKKEDVLNELLYESLSHIDTLKAHFNNNKSDECKLPLCIFIRQSKKYHPIFKDPSLTDYIIGKMIVYFKEDYSKWSLGNNKLSNKQADDIAWFQMYGCYHMTIKYLDYPSEVWTKKKDLFDQFIINALSNPTH